MRRGFGAFAIVAALIACESSIRPVQLVTYGDGSDGAVVVGEPLAISKCSTATAAGKRITLQPIETAGLRPQGLVLLHQARHTSNPGAWELARIASLSTSGTALVLNLEAELVRSYTTSDDGVDRAQVCTVPQHTRVTVAPHSTIHAEGWNGRTGGVLAFVANERVVLGSGATLQAAGAGFSYGECDVVRQNSGSHVLVTDTAAGSGLAGGKGEGFSGSTGRVGTDPVSSGGGGGALASGGGGGGAHYGRGGNGGHGSNLVPGDASVAAGRGAEGTMRDGVRLLFGGGGGAPQREEAFTVIPGEADPCGGGRGGGVIYLVTPELISEGFLSVAGASGTTSVGVLGGGGGGAGGTLFLHAESITLLQSLDASGGVGGSVVTTNGKLGPGGGGGGGRIWLPPGVPAPSTKVNGGASGLVSENGGLPDPHGSTAGDAGAAEPY